MDDDFEGVRFITGREAEEWIRDLKEHPVNWNEIIAIVIGREGCSYLLKDGRTGQHYWRHEHELLHA